MSITTEEAPEIFKDDHEMTRAELMSKWIRQDLDLMSRTDASTEAVNDGMVRLRAQIDEARAKFNLLLTTKDGSSSTDADDAAEDDNLELERDLQLLKKKVSLLKSMFPFSVIKKTKPSDSHVNWRDRSTPHSVAAPDKLMQNLTCNDKSKRPPTADELRASLRGLKSLSRICLICFLVFPKNAIIKKSLLVCWAKAHDIEFLEDPINDLIGNGLILPVYKDSLTVGGYWMHPAVHSALTKQNWFRVSDLTESVYVAGSSSDEDIIYDDSAQLSAKKELIMLHLGNWQRSSVRHVEVEDPNSFFKDMAELIKLRYISLRGISLITEIPEFLTKLENLEILDLKSCHNLEVFPSDVGSLSGSLTHLDMSECYFLEHMPKAISKLRNLQVMKGFFVGGDKKETSCTLQDLLSLEELVKLNIYTNVEVFPDDYQLSILKEFKFLRSLTISWGGCSEPRETGKHEESAATNVRKCQSIRRAGQEEVKPATTSHGVLNKILTRRGSTITRNEISFNLEKLDLQCFPKSVAPNWLNPTNFKHVKNLYIRGGQICDLVPVVCGDTSFEEYQWNVEILRLKHLSNLEMDYSDLVDLFPKLIFLENVECPNLKNFPCDAGLWKDDTQPPPTTHL